MEETFNTLSASRTQLVRHLLEAVIPYAHVLGFPAQSTIYFHRPLSLMIHGMSKMSPTDKLAPWNFIPYQS